MDTPAPETPPAAESDVAAEAAPAALSDLIAAGLVSHEMIGDPAQLGAEAPTLTALCALIGGPVYRVDPFHYAFRAAPEDLGGRLGQLAAEDWTEALGSALRAALGEDAVWLSATEPLPEAAAPLDQPLLLLRAHAAAVAEAVTAAAPGLQAVINARYAAETARLTARSITSAEAGTPLARRLAVIELRQEAILERLAAPARPADPDPALARLSKKLNETLGAILQRLDAQAAALDALGARAEDRAGQLAKQMDGLSTALADATLADATLADGAAAPAFQETLGLTLAEFLARLERQSQDSAPARVPQFN